MAVTRDSHPTPRWWEHMGCPTTFTPTQRPVGGNIWTVPYLQLSGRTRYWPYRHAQPGVLVAVRQTTITRVAWCKWWPKKLQTCARLCNQSTHRSIQGRRLNLCWFSKTNLHLTRKYITLNVKYIWNILDQPLIHFHWSFFLKTLS